MFSSSEEATLQQLESQLSVIGGKLRELEEPSGADGAAGQPGRRGKDARPGMFPAALAIPKLRAEFEMLIRDRRVVESSLVFALERLEAARAAEARDVSTFLVLDAPALPTRHSRPKRLVIVAVAFAVGLIGSLALEWWRSTGGGTAVPVSAVPPPARPRDESPAARNA
jgi:capsule polysaccharide export protein KpsE/RkpR